MAEALGNRYSSCGFEEEFVNPVDEDYHCAICKFPAKEPIQTQCGHRFCRECMEENMRRLEDNNQPLTCPVDRQGLDKDQDIFRDKATERKILSFAIKCPSEGCDWTGELWNKEVHFRYRSKLPVNCPNMCGQSFTRDMIPNHTKNDCPLAFISCPYEQTGCKRKVQRQEVESHLQSDLKPHLDLVCVRLRETCVRLRKTEVKLNNTKIKLTDTRSPWAPADTKEKLETRMFIWRIENYREILRKARTGETTRIESAPFYTDRTESYGYKLEVVIYPNGSGSDKNTHLSVYITVIKGKYDAILPWPFKKEVKFTLIHQQEDPFQRENVTGHFNPAKHPGCFARPTSEQNKA